MSPSSRSTSSTRSPDLVVCVYTASICSGLSRPSWTRMSHTRRTLADKEPGRTEAGGRAATGPPMVSDATADAAQQQLERDAILSALGDDDVRETFAWLDEGQVHRTHRVVVLLADLREGATPLLEVATDAAHEANVGVGVHVHLGVE